MFFHSIRWRLQLWHGLLLVVVLAGFGVTAYELQRGAQLRRVDEELNHRLEAVIRSLRRGPEGPGSPREGRSPDGPRGREWGPPPDHLPPGRGGLPPRPFSERGPEDRMLPPPREFQLPTQHLALFEGSGSSTNAFYYVLFTRDGERLSQSDNAPAQLPRPQRIGEGNSTRMRGTIREMYHCTPPGECIVTGKDIESELADGRRFAMLLLGAGAFVLALGLAGGWWLSTRAIRPIKDISATAARISTGDLSQRIPAGDAENELGQLANVLNSTFARLEDAFDQQARFTSDAAHELRTPISVMLTQTQSVLMRERPAAEYRETLEACQRAAQRMRRLIESLLELARLDAAQEPIKRTGFDLAKTAAECIDLLRPLAAERGIQIHTELPSTSCVGDVDRISQVITNLVGNAIHYNKKGGEVRVRAQQQDGLVWLSVADTGQGIAVEELPHIFERFWRADKSRSRANGRTGLGLAIAKSIVDAHQGTLEVSSKPGEGSVFTLKLPASENRA
jgi:two-component system, OmpR family, sensor kinase